MRIFVCLLACSIGSLACAEPVAILGKNNTRVLGEAAPAPDDARQAAFLAAFTRAAAALPTGTQSLPVENPPAWGKTISGETRGEVRFLPRFTGGFVCHLTLEHLVPDHRYILTLNGSPGRAGNDRLFDSVRGHEDEKYYDFLSIQTDGQGRYEETLGVVLASGRYDVRLYVKDTDDFRIVLYRDFFPFVVE
jgi:hypothetical protein